MTVENPQIDNRALPALDPWAGEDEIDLRQYIWVLVAWWREILTLSLLTAALAAGAVIGLRFLQDPVYRSSATVAIARTTSNINFDERFQTSFTEQNMTSVQRADVLVSTRRAALVGLVYNGAVAESVAQSLAPLLSEEDRNPSRLLRRIDAQIVKREGVSGESDLIQITASADSPELAAAIANSWAYAYVAQVNNLYGQLPDELLASVQSELSQAQTAFDDSQRKLEEFIAQNDVARLDRLIAEKKEIINSLQVGKQTAINTIVTEELQARRQIISAYINALASNRLLAFNKEQEAKRTLISTLIDSEFNNRLSAFQKDQSARRQLFDQAVQIEIDNLLLALSKDQTARRQLFGQYTDAQLENQLMALTKDQEARRQIFTHYTNAQINNQTVAFAKDQEIRRSIFNQYVDSLVTNRLIAIEKEQEGRARLFAQYVNTEIENRLKALAQEQDAKGRIFDAYANADTRAKLATFNEQVDARLQTLATSYETQLKLERLLDDARALRTQAAAGGDANAATNSLALLLLKSEVYGTAVGAPAQLQLVLGDLGAWNTGADAQVADLDAMIEALTERIATLTADIDTQSQAIFNNEDYNLLNAGRPGDDPLYAALQEKYLELFNVGDLAQAADALHNTALSQAILAKYEELFAVSTLADAGDNLWQESELLDAVLAKYEDLFDVGALASASAIYTDTTPLSQAILSQYNELFGVGALAEAGVGMLDEGELSQAILTRYEELFGTGALTSVSGVISDTTPLAEAIQARYEELFGLGTLAMASTVVSETTPLAQMIRSQYPELFAVGDLSALTEEMTDANGLALLGAERAQELLQLQGLEDLPAYTAAAAPLTQAIDTLESEIQTLQAQREREVTRRDQLTRARDLSLKTLTTLDNKNAELKLAGTGANSEVRFATPALPPLEPVKGLSLVMTTALGGIVGLMLAVFIAFFANFMGMEPLLRRQQVAGSR